MHNRNGHPCYRGSKAWKRRTIRNQAKRLLSSGPWFWPRDPRAGSEQLASTHLTEEEAALQRALDVCERGPNQLRPGRALLLTVDGAQNEEFDNGSLLTVELRPEDERNTQSVPLKDNARKAWSYASIAVTHAVDMLWKSTDGLEQKVPTLNRVEGISSTIELADGASFGLAFALAIVSDLLDQSLPVDVAATARFANEWTRLGPVGGLEAKLSAVAQYAPRVRRLLVAKAQQRDAAMFVKAQGLDLKIVGVENLEDAIEQVFPKLEDVLRSFPSEDERQEWIEDVFLLALERRNHFNNWTPLRHAADFVLDDWREQLDETQERKLEFTAAVAARHQGDARKMGIPPRPWLESQLTPNQIYQYLAHLAQNSADCGMPAHSEILALVENGSYLAQGLASDDQLKLLGAIAHLRFILGKFDDALADQLSAAAQWARRRRWAQISIPLSRAYLLAGMIGDEDAWQDAEELRDKWRRKSEPSPKDASYVNLSRGRSAAQLGDFTQARHTLESVVISEPKAVDHVHFAALRWLIYAYETDPKAGVIPARIAAKIEQMQEFAERHGSVKESKDQDEIAAAQWALVHIDRALRIGSGRRIRDAIRHFNQFGLQGIDELLERRGPSSHTEEASLIQKFCPY